MLESQFTIESQFITESQFYIKSKISDKCIKSLNSLKHLNFINLAISDQNNAQIVYKYSFGPISLTFILQYLVWNTWVNLSY